MPLPTRQPVAGGRSRRSSSSRGRGYLSFVTRWRVAGVVLAVSTAALLIALVTSRTFDLAQVNVSDLVYTRQADIRAAIDLPEGATPNVFRIETDKMERALESLPAVASADVQVTLPDKLDINVTERTPTFVLVTPNGGYVVDVEGYVLDSVAAADPSSLSLPIVTDNRAQFAPDVAVGGRLDEVSLDADLRLAAITPETVGTTFPTLTLSVDDQDGYVLTASPDGWRAIFGQYTPNLRPVDIIDRQLQCLRARVGQGEADIAVIYLAPLDDKCGTYLPRTTTAPPDSPAPSN